MSEDQTPISPQQIRGDYPVVDREADALQELEAARRIVDGINIGQTALPDQTKLSDLSRDTYGELYADTPAKKILWDERAKIAEIPDVRVRSAAQIELLGAYVTVDQGEAFSLLQEILSANFSKWEKASAQWVKSEALAKFGALTGSEHFIDQARKVAMWGSYYGFSDAVHAVAVFGQDPKCFEKATRGISGNSRVNDAQKLKELLNLGAQGYPPALTEAKKILVKYSRGSDDTPHAVSQIVLYQEMYKDYTNWTEDDDLQSRWADYVKARESKIKSDLEDPSKLFIPASIYSITEDEFLESSKPLFESAREASRAALEAYDTETV